MRYILDFFYIKANEWTPFMRPLFLLFTGLKKEKAKLEMSGSIPINGENGFKKAQINKNTKH